MPRLDSLIQRLAVPQPPAPVPNDTEDQRSSEGLYGVATTAALHAAVTAPQLQPRQLTRRGSSEFPLQNHVGKREESRLRAESEEAVVEHRAVAASVPDARMDHHAGLSAPSTPALWDSLFSEDRVPLFCQRGGAVAAPRTTSAVSVTTETDERILALARRELPRRVRPVTASVDKKNGESNGAARSVPADSLSDVREKSKEENEEEEELLDEALVGSGTATLADDTRQRGAAPPSDVISQQQEGCVCFTQLRAPPAFPSSAFASRLAPPLTMEKIHRSSDCKDTSASARAPVQSGGRCVPPSISLATEKSEDDVRRAWTVQVWVPRRLEQLRDSATVAGERAAASTAALRVEGDNGMHGGPQPVLWRRPIPLDGGVEEYSRQQMSVRPDARERDNRVSPRASSIPPSPLSSTQWSVSAYECIGVHLYPSAGGFPADSTPADEPASEHTVRRGWTCGGGDDSCSCHSDDDEAEEEGDEGGGAAMPNADAEAAGEEEEAGAAATTAAVTGSDGIDVLRGYPARACRRARCLPGPQHGSRACPTRRVDQHEVSPFLRKQQQQRTRLSASLRPSGFSCSRAASASRQPRAELRLSLPWLLHSCTLPPTAAALLRSWLEAYVCAAMPADPHASSASANHSPNLLGDRMRPLENTSSQGHAAAQPLPFWITAFAYTQEIQSCATIFASRVVHEAEKIAAMTGPPRSPRSNRDACVQPLPTTGVDTAVVGKEVTCIPWPSWVPTVEWSTQVLTALLSAAFVLIGDVAQALQRAEKRSASLFRHGLRRSASEAAPPSRSTGPVKSPLVDSNMTAAATLSELLSEFHVFCNSVFGDAESKKLCRHVRARLPLHVADLSDLLRRPLCCADSFRSAAATQSRWDSRRTAQPVAPGCEEEWRITRAAEQHSHTPSTGGHCNQDEARRACFLGGSPSRGRATVALQASTTSVAPQPATTCCPSMLDLVHHLAHAWMQQCFPALARQLHQFVLSHDPGVLLDQWSSQSSALEAQKADRWVEVPYADATSQAVLHDAMFECIHDFVHGVLHRWVRWSSSSVESVGRATTVERSGATRTDTSASPVLLFDARRTPALSEHAGLGSGAGLQWRAHMNYAKMQAFQWLLQHTCSSHGDATRLSKDALQRMSEERATRDVGCFPRTLRPRTVLSDGRAAAAAAVGPVTDMKTVLEQLTVLPALFESALLPHEIHSGLRHACETTQLTLPHQHQHAAPQDFGTGRGITDNFCACFRLFFGMACYGATLMSDSGVAAALHALPRTGASTSTAAATAAAWADVTADRKPHLQASLETAESTWKAWILPLVVRFDESCCHAAGQGSSTAASGHHGNADLDGSLGSTLQQDPLTSALPATTRASIRVLAVADHLVRYALSLLQLVRSTQRDLAFTIATTRKTSPASTAGSSSRKRHRQLSCDNAGHQRQRCSRHHVRCNSVNTCLTWRSAQVVAHGTLNEATDAAVRGEGEEEDDEGEEEEEEEEAKKSCSLCTPGSVSSSLSYATVSTATTTSLAKFSSPILLKSGGSGGGGGARETSEAATAERRTHGLGGGPTRRADGAFVFMSETSKMPSAQPKPVDGAAKLFSSELSARPLPAQGTASSPSSLLVAAADWREACQHLAWRWMSRASSRGHHSWTGGHEHDDDDGRGAGYAVHRRDVRYVRAFLLCLQYCVHQVQHQQQQQQQQGKEALGNGIRSDDDDHQFHEFYDYLYGVLPPGLRDGEAGVHVWEAVLPPSPSSAATANLMDREEEEDSGKKPRKKSSRHEEHQMCSALRDFHADDTLHLTSTDSMSGGSDEGKSAEHALINENHNSFDVASTSTTLVSSLSSSSSASSSSTTQSMEEC